jgi:hypothetical protein
MAQNIIHTPAIRQRPLLRSNQINITQDASQIFASRGQGLQENNAFAHKLFTQ